MRNVLLVPLFLFLTFEVFAQSPANSITFSKVSAPLSHSQASCILQDSRGFLWVGTEDGLNWYDGYEFKVYRHNPDDSTSLLKNTIHSLFEDSRGVLWISTSNGGLQVYDREQDNFKRLPQYSFDCEIGTFHEDDSSVWIGGVRHGKAFVDQVHKLTGSERNYILFDSPSPLHALIPASDHTFWFGVRGIGLFHWDFRKKEVRRQGPPSDLHRIVKDGQDLLWIATKTGLQKYNVKTGQYVFYNTHSKPELPVDNILSLCVDGNYLWIGTENGGLCRLNKTTNEILTFQADKDDPESVPDNSIWALYRDQQERIWVGTYSNGIAVVDPMLDKFWDLDLPSSNDIVNAILLDSKSRLWVGTEDGLIMKSSQGIRHYRHTEAKGSLQTNPVLAIYEDAKQRIWVGTWEGGLNRYDDLHDNFIHYMPDEKRNDALSNPNVFSIWQSRETHQLLVGTYDGLNVLDEETGSFQHIREGKFAFNNYIRAIYQDSKGNVWVGTIEELLRYDQFSKKLNRFESSTNRDSIRVAGLCNSIIEDKKGRLWVGTREGLHLLVNGAFKIRYTINDGLGNNTVQGVLEDRSGNLWMSTAVGISKFDPETAVFRNYDIADGVRGSTFKPNSSFRHPNGQLFFGGKGICYFNPDSVLDNPYKPEVFITELGILNDPVLPGDETGILQHQISETGEISIPPEFNYFSLKYVAVNFTSSSKNRYAYMLKNFHSDWNYVGDQRSVMFTNLDPGTYTFLVKACNNDGLWNSVGTQLVIHILPPWWKTWWATLAGCILLIAIIRILYKLRVRSMKLLNRRLEVQVQKRTEQLAQQNEELIQSQEEIAAQRDVVSAQNAELQKARLIIESQNNDISLRNESLEAEVEERTRDLVEYNQQLEQFAFISAHNLRAPVARILGLGNILEINSNDPDETRTIIEKMVYTSQELDRVVRDLNTVLEIRRNSNSTITPIDLKEEVRLIKINLEKEISDTKTKFIEDFSKGVTLWAAKPYVDSILLNLIGNAIKYRHPARTPVIKIRSEVTDNQFNLTIQDNGLGMDVNLYKDKIFTLYNRFHLHIEGKGLGLYLVKTQLTAMGGKIEVESKVNEGTAFHLVFKHTQEV
jgi:ligand-binding sensor domain-containing protein